MRTMNVTRSRSTVVSQARAYSRFLVLQLDNNDANPTMRSCRKARGGAFVCKWRPLETSALAHERTLERGSGMSASSPRADMLSVEHGMSAKCQKQTCWQ